MTPACSNPDRSNGRPRLSREITVALLIKLAILIGLWFMFFRGHTDKHSAEKAVQGWFPPAVDASQSRIP